MSYYVYYLEQNEGYTLYEFHDLAEAQAKFAQIKQLKEFRNKNSSQGSIYEVTLLAGDVLEKD